MEEKQFPGFPKEPKTNYWRCPRVLNGWWHILTPAEQSVLFYLLRHTWGYSKSSDKISLSQFERGIQGVDGGTGLSKRHIIRALKSLERQRYINIKRTRGGKGLAYINEYSLQIVTEGNYNNDKVSLLNSDKGKQTKTDLSKKDTKIPVRASNLAGSAIIPLKANETNRLIALFKNINPSYEQLFKNKTQRAAIERLVKKFGVEQVGKMIDGLKKIFGQPYAPTITTPYLLEQKLADYIGYIKKRSQEKINFIDFTKL